jgi:cobaltochelatase CobN
MSRKVSLKTLLVAALVALAVAGFTLYRIYGSPTRVAFVNYPEYVLAPLLDQEINPAIRAEAVAWNEKKGGELEHYDMIVFFGMGLHFTAEQQQILDKLKVPVYVTASTREETALNSLSESQFKAMEEYLGGGGKENFRRMLDFIRYEIDGKRFNAPKPEPPKEVLRSAFFHVDEENAFKTYQEYAAWYRKSGNLRPDAPTVCILAGNGGGDLGKLIEALEKRGLNVVAANGMMRLPEMVEEAQPDLVIYQPHGRFSMRDPDAGIALLKAKNIPLFCPIKVNQPYEEYLRDQRGMTGGMLSQSVTMPELDGGTTPFVLSALFRNARGLLEFRMIPDRLERFAELVKKTTDLKRKPNAEKKIAIVFYKGPGKNALNASGLEVGDSVLNTLKNLRDAGYHTGPLPETPAELDAQIQQNAATFGNYAEGAMQNFVKNATTVVITPDDYRSWVARSMPADLYQSVVERYGDFPGKYFRTAEGNMVLGQLRFGNVILMPQSLPGKGGDESKLIHGVKMAPPHTYIATYLYIRYGFQADAMMHFGTHGSLEFTPWKQVALSSYDWPDVLVGALPHYYLYIINNVGEALIAKRRSYATMVSHLTAPFMVAEGYGAIAALHEKLHHYETSDNPMLKGEYAKSIIDAARKEHYDRDLKLSPDFAAGILTDEDLARIHNYIHEIESAKVNRGLYVIGRPYSDAEADETARLMTVDTIADALFNADLAVGKVKPSQRQDLHFFTENYLEPAADRAGAALADPAGFKKPAAAMPAASGEDIARMAQSGKLPDGSDIPPEMAAAIKGMTAGGGDPAGSRQPARTVRRVPSPEEIAIEAKTALLDSTRAELEAMLNAFNGGYLAPSPGGDPVLNPATVPTGRNLYGIDPERTPTRESYAVGRQLADALIAEKRKSTGEYPKKVAFSLWGGEFIRTQGVNIGEIFYLLGVEPVWDSRGRVQDVRLIPLGELKRPRIDVVVQTSGQFRGAAASRMRLIDKAVRLAAADAAGEFGNYVREGSLEAVKSLIASGLSPEQAKSLADARIFGGINGNFGTGVTGMIQAGDRWDDAKVIADLYLHNMGALYTEDHWGEHVPGVFKAALTNTDTVVQSRSSNSWGPLSLDHVYEFTGGISLAVRAVTGKDPKAYFNDLRTPGRAKIQEAGEAAMVEARSTVLNPKYIKEMMEEGPSGAGSFAEVFRNTYGWEVTKPDMIEDHLWREYKEVYVDDKLKLDIRKYFEEKNPYALQEMTAVMLETVRKGYWKADAETVRRIAETHAELVQKFDAGCSGFVCDNAKLREFINRNLSGEELRKDYNRAVETVRTRTAEPKEEVTGRTMKEQVVKPEAPKPGNTRRALWIFGSIILLGVAAMALGGRGRPVRK